MARNLNFDPFGGPAPGDSGTTFSGGSADPISGQMSKIRSIIGPTNLPPVGTGSPTPSFGAGPNSSDILRQGINLIGSQGTSLSNAGNLLLGGGLATAQPGIDFFSALLSGDPSKMTAALAPTANTIENQYQPLIANARQNLPRGGFAAGTEAELPFTIANQVGNKALDLQSGAAQFLASLGIDLSKLGLTEQGIGQTGIQDIINAALGKMGVTTGITSNLANVGNFLSSLI